MRYQVFTSIDECSDLADEWNAALGRSRANCIFLTWEWLVTWLSLHDAAARLFVIVVRDDDDRLVGAAPFYCTRYVFLGTATFRALRVIGDVDSGAEYQSWFADRDHETAVNAAIVEALKEFGGDWDFIWLPKQSNWNEAIENVVQMLRSGGFEVRERPCAFSTVRLPGDFDEFMSGIPAKRRQQLRRMSRKILGAPGVEIRRVENEQELTAALDALFSLHEQRWNLVGEEGAFNKRPGKRTFYERFAPVALQNGWLGMYELLDNGVPKAVQFGYVYNNVLLQLQEGFDPDYQSNVGNVLRGYVIEDCIANRITEYDFLAGTSEHKRRWCSEIRIGSDVLIVRKTIKNLPLTAVRLWPTGAYLKPYPVARAA